MRTTFGLIKTYDYAKAAVEQFVDKNFPKDEINLIVQRSAVENAWNVNERTIDLDVAEKIGTEYKNQKVDGIDEMLGKQRPILTNAAGEIYAAGDVAKMMAKTAALPGMGTDGLRRVLEDFGVAGETAKTYAEGIRSGLYLVAVRTTDERSSEAKKLLGDVKAAHVATFRG